MNIHRSVAAAAAVAALLPVALFAQEAPQQTGKTAAPVVCAVVGEPIADVAKAAGKVEYKGKTYYFCCPGCKGKWEKADDAAKSKMVRLTDLRVEKMTLQKRLEAIDAEIKQVEAPAEVKTTAAVKPAVVYCAVTDEEIGAPDQAAATVTYSGRTYYICCPGCKPKFDSDPAKYAKMADSKAAERARKQ